MTVTDFDPDRWEGEDLPHKWISWMLWLREYTAPVDKGGTGPDLETWLWIMANARRIRKNLPELYPEDLSLTRPR